MLTEDELVALCVERIAESPKQARRVFHGRGRTWPGYEQLVVTWFAPYVLIACYGEQNLQHGKDLAE